MTYFGEKVIGNFKPSLRQRAREKNRRSDERRSRRDGNDNDHLALIRQLPCVACLAQTPPVVKSPSDPHHLKSGAARLERGMGQRSTDKYTVPLCRAHHDDVERIGSAREERWFAAIGISDPCELAAALWRVTGDLRAMVNVLFTNVGADQERRS